MRKEIIPDVKYVRFCDADGCTNRSKRMCNGCGIDLCGLHGTWWEVDMFDGRCMGDYYPLCCNRCQSLAEACAPQARAILDEADRAAERIRAAWKEQCANGIK